MTSREFFDSLSPLLQAASPQAAQSVIQQFDQWLEDESLPEIDIVLRLMLDVPIDDSLRRAYVLDALLAALAVTRPFASVLTTRTAFANALRQQLSAKFGAKRAELVLQGLI
jgi:hypothetical protein